MKTRHYLVGLGLLAITSLTAAEPVKTGKIMNLSGIDYYDEPIQFEERGIIFYVFLNGDFDFNTSPSTHVDYMYKNRSKHYAPIGVKIERDGQGRIRRVGNVFISYSHYDQVKRIGSVFIDYRNGHVERIGNMDIVYGRYGVRFIGSVKGYYETSNRPFNGQYSTWEYGYYDPFFNSRDFYQDYEDYDEDDNYYYFRTKDYQSADKMIIKRKKESNSSKNESRRKL